LSSKDIDDIVVANEERICLKVREPIKSADTRKKQEGPD
jgi:hypothetical protein